MEKHYPHQHEPQQYTAWEQSGKMRADKNSAKPPFVVPLPPPNVTGQLHLGHAAMLAVEDILVRFKAMTGHEVLWMPGMDHAAIATENVVLRHHDMKSREEVPREDFMRLCRNFTAKSRETIVGQSKRMGAWLDWSRETYTFDPERNEAVNEMFRMLYADGLIERGYRLINWSVGAQSVLADDEVEWEERTETFYEIQCGPFVIGTVRPETKCADSPVVVHPEDPRYKHLIGQEFEYETYAGPRKFYVLGDEAVDPEFGTGAMTISTAHDAHDYALAQKYDLPIFQKIGFDGRMTDVAGPCAGMTVAQARKKSVELMREKGLIVREKEYVHNVPLCYRTGTVVEPMLSSQWFVMVEKPFTDRHTGKTMTLKQIAQEAVREKHVRIIPERFNKIYFQWIDNLRDWCISRQIWWGHRIPVWYDDAGNELMGVKRKIIFARHGQSEANAEGIIQGYELDTDLTELGQQQAAALGAKMKEQGIEYIVSSNLKRAAQTADVVAETLGTTVERWEDLKETGCGDMVGTPDSDEEGLQRALHAQKTGESWDDVRARAEAVWARIAALPGEGPVLVVGHGAFTSAMMAVREGRQSLDRWYTWVRHWEMKNTETVVKYITKAPEEAVRQDEDTLDTWFSSALWPMSPLGWPNEDKPDFDKFYPASVLETGHDILFFWVARMILFGRYATGKYPFHTVYLHGLVCDEKGKKMSKSKGNGIDPLELIDSYGADAVRLSLVIGTSPGNNIPLGTSKIGGYRNFVNKLWNAARFVRFQLDQSESDVVPTLEPKTITEQWMASRLSRAVQDVRTSLEAYHISSAGDRVYHFVWGEFCDWYIEASKQGGRPEFTLGVFLEVLKLVHPLCPYVTERAWESLMGESVSLLDFSFPDIASTHQSAEDQFAWLQDVVGAVRVVRGEKNVNPKQKLTLFLSPEASAKAHGLERVLESLAGVQLLSHAQSDISAPGIALHVGGVDVWLDVPVDEAAEQARKEKELAAVQKNRAALEARLANKKYTENAPAHLVAETRQKLEDAKAHEATLLASLAQ